MDGQEKILDSKNTSPFHTNVRERKQKTEKMPDIGEQRLNVLKCTEKRLASPGAY